MCFSQPKPPQDNSAEIARQQNAEREARVRAGQGQIDQAFAQYDPTFYSNAEKAYLDYYSPQLADQFSDAKRQTIFNLSRSGNREATAGADAFADLTKRHDLASQQITSGAADHTQNLRNRVETQRSGLYDLNSSAADPTLVSSRLAAATQDLSAPVSFSPLENVFASLLNQGATGLAIGARNGVDLLDFGLGPRVSNPRSSGGGYVVG